MKLLYADDHKLVREAIARVLTTLSDQVEVIEASDLPSAAGIAEAETDLDLIILDLYMPGMTLPGGIEHISAISPDVPIVVLTGSVNIDDAQKSLAVGASGYIPKTIGSLALVSAIQLVLSGEKYLPAMLLDENASPNQLSESKEQAYSVKMDSLTPRECDVLRLLIDGNSNKAIARDLDVQEVTVKVHLQTIYRKLDVSNRTQAVREILEVRGAPGGKERLVELGIFGE